MTLVSPTEAKRRPSTSTSSCPRFIAGGATLSCLARDEGSFRVSRASLESLSADPDARLSVRRVRLASFDAPGIDVAYARVAATRTVALTLR